MQTLGILCCIIHWCQHEACRIKRLQLQLTDEAYSLRHRRSANSYERLNTAKVLISRRTKLCASSVRLILKRTGNKLFISQAGLVTMKASNFIGLNALGKITDNTEIPIPMTSADTQAIHLVKKPIDDGTDRAQVNG